MLLVIDIGNSFVKYAVFEQVNLIQKHVVNINDAEENFLKIIKKHPKIKQCIYSGVGKAPENLLKTLENQLNCTVVSQKTKIPFVNLYQTPTTLGIDRLCLAAGASLIYPNKNVLVIDAGTCITYDLINNKNEYLGGGISPGLNMRYKALNYYTAKLPLLEKNKTVIEIGKNTTESINFGIDNGIIFEIEGFISKFSVKNPNLIIILTGGDTNFLANRLKSTIFADENFLLKSLQQLHTYILEND